MDAVAAAVLPYEDADGLTKYFIVGDSRGRVFVFSVVGDALLELQVVASSESQVSSCAAHPSSPVCSQQYQIDNLEREIQQQKRSTCEPWNNKSWKAAKHQLLMLPWWVCSRLSQK